MMEEVEDDGEEGWRGFGGDIWGKVVDFYRTL